MKYNATVKGRFVNRPNRFIANVEINGEICVCHVKNTGRCKELLIEGARVILAAAQNPERKTAYDLVAVYKGERLVNIDSQAPNKIFGEFVPQCGLFGKLTLIKPETKYKNSRFDFYMENETEKIFAEIKGVTLEKDNAVFFPDAPTSRGAKRLKELAEAKKEGYRAAVVFVVQTENVDYFAPNSATDPAFARELRFAAAEGVEVYAFDCHVEENSITARKAVEVRL